MEKDSGGRPLAWWVKVQGAIVHLHEREITLIVKLIADGHERARISGERRSAHGDRGGTRPTATLHPKPSTVSRSYEDALNVVR